MLTNSTSYNFVLVVVACAKRNRERDQLRFDQSLLQIVDYFHGCEQFLVVRVGNFVTLYTKDQRSSRIVSNKMCHKLLGEIQFLFLLLLLYIPKASSN